MNTDHPYIQKVLEVAMKHEAGVLTHDNNVLMVTIRSEKKDLIPVLITADEGKTWCPGALKKGNSVWECRNNMTGRSLHNEIKVLCNVLGIDNSKLVRLAEDLMYEFHGKKFS